MEFPKRNRERIKPLISPYLIYVQERREALKEEQLNMEPQEFVRALAEEWKHMTEEEKIPYIEKAEANKMLRLQERMNNKK